MCAASHVCVYARSVVYDSNKLFSIVLSQTVDVAFGIFNRNVDGVNRQTKARIDVFRQMKVTLWQWCVRLALY